MPKSTEVAGINKEGGTESILKATMQMRVIFIETRENLGKEIGGEHNRMYMKSPLDKVLLTHPICLTWM